MKKIIYFTLLILSIASCGKKAKELLENHSFVITDRWENGHYMMSTDAETQQLLIDSLYVTRKDIILANKISFAEFKSVLIDKMDQMSYQGYRFFKDSLSDLDTRFPDIVEMKEAYELDESKGIFRIIGPTGYKEEYKFELINNTSFTLEIDGVKIKLTRLEEK